MTRLRLLREAAEELQAVAEFYGAEQPALGRAFVQELRRTLHFIREQPLATRAHRGNIRVRTVARFLYRIYYQASEREILVLAIAHRRRRPGYWRSRT